MFVCFGIIHQPCDQIHGIATVFPIIEVASGKNPIGPQGSRDGMQSGDQVYKQVARYARAVFLKIAPTEKAGSIKRAFGGIAQETIPINGLGVDVERHGIVPGSERIATIHGGLHVIDLPDEAFFVPLARFVNAR